MADLSTPATQQTPVRTPPVRTHLITDADDLPDLARAWRRLDDGVPFRGFNWLTTWWTHYGTDPRRELFVLVVERDGAGVVAIAPCYLHKSFARGNVIRLLGDGEVCSDHLSLLCAEPELPLASAAIADWLCAHRERWDRLDWESVDTSDPNIDALRDALTERGCDVATRSAGRCWSIDLPADWEQFLSMQSKSHRKQLRQADRRVLQSSRAKWHLVSCHDELNVAWPVLIDLHQRRRQSLGEPGCFASAAFSAFHRDVAEQLIEQGSLRLSWLELDGVPVAAEYHLAGGNATYAYQGGVDPERLADEPGRLSNMATIQAALAEGHTRFDFLRGDEPYKAHWRAHPHETIHLSAASPRTTARIRNSAIATATNVARWLKGASDTPSLVNED